MGQLKDCPADWWSNVYFDRLGLIQWDSLQGAARATQWDQSVFVVAFESAYIL